MGLVIPHGEVGAVAIFMGLLMNNEPCTLYHFPNELLGMIRDYCFVGDVVKANLLALDQGQNDTISTGTGKKPLPWIFSRLFLSR